MQLLLQLKMEDAQEFYDTEAKKNEETFLEELKNGKDLEIAEKDYKKRTKKTQEQYEKRFNKEVNMKEKKKKKKKKKEEERVLDVTGISLEQTWYDKLKFKIAQAKFRVGRKKEALFRQKIFNKLKYFYFKLKYSFKNVMLNLEIVKRKIFNKFTDIYKTLKEASIKTISYLTSLLKSLSKYTHFKKNQGGKEDDTKNSKKGKSLDTKSKDNTKKDSE